MLSHCEDFVVCSKESACYFIGCLVVGVSKCSTKGNVDDGVVWWWGAQTNARALNASVELAEGPTCVRRVSLASRRVASLITTN